MGIRPVKHINQETVKKLQLVWSWAVVDKRTESQPLVHDGVMFLNQSASIVHALDAANGDLLMEWTGGALRSTPASGGDQEQGARHASPFQNTVANLQACSAVRSVGPSG